MRFEELPSFMPGMRTWGARVGALQFVISFEDGTELRLEDRPEWVGYRASYQDHSAPKTKTVRIEGKWDRFVDAEAACRNLCRQLRQKH